MADRIPLNLPSFDKLLLDACTPPPIVRNPPRSRVFPNGAFEDTSPVFDEEGVPPGFVDEVMLGGFRDMKRLLTPSVQGKGITHYSSPLPKLSNIEPPELIPYSELSKSLVEGTTPILNSLAPQVGQPINGDTLFKYFDVTVNDGEKEINSIDAQVDDENMIN